MLLSFSPQWYLTISKIADTYYFRPIRLSTNTIIYQLLPYLLIIAASMISIFYLRYHKFIRSIENANLEVSRQISASETTSKVFCHFIKNELLGIQSEIAVLPTTTENKQQVEQLLEHCHLLYNRIDSIHRSTKNSELRLKKNSLQMILNSTLDLFAQDLEHISVNNYLPKENVLVLVDDHYFSQALHNLIHNAITALDDKGKVTDFYPTLTFWLYQADKWLVFSIEDNGIGISENNLSQIFTPFFSSKSFSEHWGIGLSLTHKIINAHDGQIQVESAFGRGSCFKIYLPNIYNVDP
ncbi:MAG: HAMP domain-containing histidine kinase [Anaerolineaceae bacterium]|nr:HAMP domain-containing histidine kinase [Anaerolineaceae bacterium]